MLGEDDHPALLPKTKGSGIMVSDFAEEHNSCRAQFSKSPIPRSARMLFEYGADKEGYWTGDWFMAQMKTACDIAEAKYKSSKSQNTMVLVFDHSSYHRIFDETALLVKNIILVKDGGARRVRDETLSGQKASSDG